MRRRNNEWGICEGKWGEMNGNLKRVGGFFFITLLIFFFENSNILNNTNKSFEESFESSSFASTSLSKLKLNWKQFETNSFGKLKVYVLFVLYAASKRETFSFYLYKQMSEVFQLYRKNLIFSKKRKNYFVKRKIFDFVKRKVFDFIKRKI